MASFVINANVGINAKSWSTAKIRGKSERRGVMKVCGVILLA